MQIIDDTVLQFRLPYQLADDVYSCIDKCEIRKSEEEEKELLLYWGHEETQRLTQICDAAFPNPSILKVPSPIMRDYAWPGVYKPFDHQKETAAFLSIRPRAFCFNEAGTGKTSAAIWAADYLMTIGAIKKVLVICPLSIMHSAWQADILRTAMHRTCAVAYGPQEKRKKIIRNNYEFTIINYDGTHIFLDELQKSDFDLIIVDEANAYKTVSTRRWKTLAKLMQPHTWLWMMTGTPASQSPVDAFGLAKLVSPYRVPKFMTAWRDKVMMQVTRFKWTPKKSSRDDVFHALQPAIRITKAECLDLPEVMYQTREVPLTTQVQAYYKRLPCLYAVGALLKS